MPIPETSFAQAAVFAVKMRYSTSTNHTPHINLLHDEKSQNHSIKRTFNLLVQSSRVFLCRLSQTLCRATVQLPNCVNMLLVYLILVASRKHLQNRTVTALEYLIIVFPASLVCFFLGSFFCLPSIVIHPTDIGMPLCVSPSAHQNYKYMRHDKSLQRTGIIAGAPAWSGGRSAEFCVRCPLRIHAGRLRSMCNIHRQCFRQSPAHKGRREALLLRSPRTESTSQHLTLRSRPTRRKRLRFGLSVRSCLILRSVRWRRMGRALCGSIKQIPDRALAKTTQRYQGYYRARYRPR